MFTVRSAQPVVGRQARSLGRSIQTAIEVAVTLVDTVQRRSVCRRHGRRAAGHHRFTNGRQLEPTGEAVVADVGRRDGVKPVVGAVGEISRRMEELKAVLGAVHDVCRVGKPAAERFHAETEATDARLESVDIRLEQVDSCVTDSLVGMKVTSWGGLVCTEQWPIDDGLSSRRRALRRRRLEPVADWMRRETTVAGHGWKPVIAGRVGHVMAVQQRRIPHAEHLVAGRRLWRWCDRLALHFSFRNCLRYAGTRQC